VREALGEEEAMRAFHRSTAAAAYRWCDLESARSGLSGMDVFHHYMQRLSARGWGLFDGAGIDATTGTGTVMLRHSSFVADAGPGGKACGFCAGWAPGALEWVARARGLDWRLAGHEARCAAEGFAHCELSVVAVP
jgi:hypothetical protein